MNVSLQHDDFAILSDAPWFEIICCGGKSWVGRSHDALLIWIFVQGVLGSISNMGFCFKLWSYM